MNHKYLPLIAAILGILLLYSISLFNQPIVISIDQIENYEGRTITTEGKVIEYQENKYENQLITIQNENYSLLLFLENPIDVHNGDEIKATGTVQRYNEDWELIIDSQENILIINKWENCTISLNDIAQNPTHYIQQNINITGYVDLIFDDYFHLKDENQRYTFFVKKPYKLNTTLYSGKLVNIKAFFNYDPEQTRYVFELTDENHSITTVMENP